MVQNAKVTSITLFKYQGLHCRLFVFQILCASKQCQTIISKNKRSKVTHKGFFSPLSYSFLKFYFELIMNNNIDFIPYFLFQNVQEARTFLVVAMGNVR